MPATTHSSPRQPIEPASRLPASGATTGATPPTSISRLNARAASRPVVRSETIARARTIPAAPLIPCTSRAATSQGIEPAIAAAALART